MFGRALGHKDFESAHTQDTQTALACSGAKEASQMSARYLVVPETLDTLVAKEWHFTASAPYLRDIAHQSRKYVAVFRGRIVDEGKVHDQRTLLPISHCAACHLSTVGTMFGSWTANLQRCRQHI